MTKTIKAKPVIRKDGDWVLSDKDNATHIILHFPFKEYALKVRVLPVQTKGTRVDSRNWSWNGDIENPTLKPSIKTVFKDIVCHSFVNGGIISFLGDCTHNMVNTKETLVEIV
jgi:hypothetical protein